MTFKQNLVKARSHLVLIVGILVAFSAVVTIERHSPSVLLTGAGAAEAIIVTSSDEPPLPAPRPLSDQEREWAEIAWRYFVNNTQPATGLVNSVDGFPSSTMWDTASYLMAAIAAQRIGLLPRDEFDRRIRAALASLARMPLFQNQLPNKAYDTQSLSMVDYANHQATDGIGWSAIDIGRLEVPFNILVWAYPELTDAVRAVTARWSLPALVENGELVGASRSGGKVQRTQEGRLGYEQYAARTLLLVGVDCAVSAAYTHRLGYVDVYGVPVPIDVRDPSHFGAQNYVVSEPYVLYGLEFGLGGASEEFTWRLLKVQEARYRATGQLTAVTEDHIDQKPYFVYNSIYSGGKTWVTITGTGEDASSFRSLSTKAAFGWHALYRSEYTHQLVGKVDQLYDPTKGWYAGRYEKTGLPNKALNANTNAVVLESLAYIEKGPLLSF